MQVCAHFTNIICNATGLSGGGGGGVILAEALLAYILIWVSEIWWQGALLLGSLGGSLFTTHSHKPKSGSIVLSERFWFKSSFEKIWRSFSPLATWLKGCDHTAHHHAKISARHCVLEAVKQLCDEVEIEWMTFCYSNLFAPIDMTVSCNIEILF